MCDRCTPPHLPNACANRVMVACRDGRLYSIKEGDVRGTAVLTGNVIDLGSQAIAMAREDKVCHASQPAPPAGTNVSPYGHR